MRLWRSYTLLVLTGAGILPVYGQLVQAGPKLVASDAVGAAEQDAAVAISADGNTLLVGGPYDRLHGEITVAAGNPTDLIIDINGYFAP